MLNILEYTKYNKILKTILQDMADFQGRRKHFEAAGQLFKKGTFSCRYQFLKYVRNHGYHFGKILQSY